MMLKRISIITTALIGLTATSYAAPERVIFNSEIFSVTDTFGFTTMYPNAAVGHTLGMSYIVDPSAPNLHLPSDDPLENFPANGTYNIRFEAMYLDGVAVSTPLAPIDTLLKVQYYPYTYITNYTLMASTGTGPIGSQTGYIGGVDVRGQDILTGTQFPDLAATIAIAQSAQTYYHVYALGHDTLVKGNIKSLAFEPVPEPASMAALGLGAVALLRRRRRA